MKTGVFISFFLLFLLSAGCSFCQSTFADLDALSVRLLDERKENIMYGQSLIKSDVNENRLVMQIIHSSKEIESDLGYFTMILTAYESMETDPDRKVLGKILDHIKISLFAKLAHEKEFLEKRMPLAKKEKTKNIGNILLKNLSELESSLHSLNL